MGHRLRTGWELLRGRRWGPLAVRVARGTFPAMLLRYSDDFLASLDHPRRRSVPSLHVRPAGVQDLDRLAGLRPRAADFRGFLDQGHRCFVGELDGAVVSMSWVEGGRTHVSRAKAYRFVLEPGEIWSFGSFVHPAHRRRGLFAAHISAVLGLLAAEGCVRLVCAIDGADIRSLNAHWKAGYVPFARLRVVRILGSSVHVVRPLGSGAGRLEVGFGRWTGHTPPSPMRPHVV